MPSRPRLVPISRPVSRNVRQRCVYVHKPAGVVFYGAMSISPIGFANGLFRGNMATETGSRKTEQHFTSRRSTVPYGNFHKRKSHSASGALAAC
jgi:hypothetical protein